MTGDNCDICKMIADETSMKLFEDEQLVAFLSPTPSVEGHTIVMPKEHFTIIEQVPDSMISHLFTVVNKISSSLFESLGAQGTNIVVSNGVAAGQKTAHFLINILPRKPEDGVDFNWQPKQLSEEEMSTIEMKLKEECSKIGEPEKEEVPKPVLVEGEKEKPKDPASKEVNYLIRQLERIP